MEIKTLEKRVRISIGDNLNGFCLSESWSVVSSIFFHNDSMLI